MTDDQAGPRSDFGSSKPAVHGASPTGRVQTMAFQGLVNWLVRGLLRAPLLSRGVGSQLITLYLVGRKSGKRYSVPVAYTPHEGVLLIGSPFAWGRNLRTGEPVEVRFKGKRRWADVRVLTDEAAVVEDYAVMARANRNFARFNKIGFDDHDDPRPSDLHLAWAAGARAFRLRLR
jgi:deazaflavin-dependent oxidoreductase (nitroreductase family)